MFKVSEHGTPFRVPRSQRHGSKTRQARLHWLVCCVATSFSDVAGSETELNTSAVVLSADVDVKG